MLECPPQEPKPSPVTTRIAQIGTRNGPRRKITVEDVECMAKLIVTRRMTETEATAILGIDANAWWKWKNKQKNAGKNEKVLACTRAAYIESQIANMEDASVGAGPHKRADWRASHALLGIVDRTRYGNDSTPEARQPASQPTIVNVWLESALIAREPKSACTAREAQVLDVKETKLITQGQEQEQAQAIDPCI